MTPDTKYKGTRYNVQSIIDVNEKLVLDCLKERTNYENVFEKS